MATAAIIGAGWGALHAVTGPDHLLSLAPASAAAPRGAWRIGLWWGTGHALGTLAWAALAAAALRFAPDLLDPAWVGPAARGLAGASLVTAGVLAWRRLRRGDAAAGEARRASLAVGAVHGLTGATAVLLALPVLVSGGGTRAAWLAGFTVGSTAAMAGLTAVLGATAVGLSRAGLRRAVAASSAGSVGLGLAWVLA
jgi:hypothetical protein